MTKHRNTLRDGSVRCIVFRELDTWYAAGLEFNIVGSGTFSQVVILVLSEALTGYVESAKKMDSKSAISILNPRTDFEYYQFWNSLQKKKPIMNKQVSLFGRRNISGMRQVSFA